MANFTGVPRAAAPRIKSGRNKGAARRFLGMEQVWEIQYKYDPQHSLSERVLNKHRRKVNRQVMQHWHEFMLPIHFTSKGVRKYRFKKRTNTTNKVKRELFGHVKPINMKGDAETMSQTIKSLRVTPTKGTLTIKGPWYMGQIVTRKRGGKSPDLKQEIRTTDHADAMKLARLGGKLLKKRIEADRKRKLGQRRRRVKGK